MIEILYLAVAGALGTVSRYLLSGGVYRLMGSDFAYGTLCVNILGSFVIGLIMQVGINTDVIPRSLMVVITTGFLGAFTTFSAFSYETISYVENGVWVMAAINIIANVVICLLATWAGITVGKMAFGGA